MSEELPSGWHQIKFTEILDINGGTQPPKSEFIFEQKTGYIRLLQIRDFGKKPVPTYIPDDGKRKTCTKKDILIGRYGASVGRICTGMEGAYNVALAKVTKPEQISFGYLKYFLKSDLFQKPLSMLSRSAQDGFNKQDLAEFNFPLPPENEQIRIANKLDRLLAEVYAAQTRLEKIPTLLKRFRQAVLATATSGELTREWRNNQDAAWNTVALGDVAKGFNYGTSSKSQPEGKVPVLRMGNLQRGNLDWTNLVYTSDEAEIQKYLLEPGDVLFNRTNSPELVGKTSIYRGERKGIYAGYLIRIKGTEYLDSEYINIQLNSPNAREYCWQVKTDGVSQSNINAKKIQAYEFEMPPIKEQKEIVRRVDFLFSKADIVERQYQQAKRCVDRLIQSLLTKAFRGELVPQDPDDEPASELLRRIKATPKTQQIIKPKQITENTYQLKLIGTSIHEIDIFEKKPFMKLLDTPEKYLFSLLVQLGNEASAEDLWKKSGLNIDEFYAKLKQEMQGNLIFDDNNSRDPTLRKLKIVSKQTKKK